MTSSQDETISYPSGGGAHLFRGALAIDESELAEHVERLESEGFCSEEIERSIERLSRAVGAILEWSDLGFLHGSLYFSAEELDLAWSAIEEQEREIEIEYVLDELSFAELPYERSLAEELLDEPSAREALSDVPSARSLRDAIAWLLWFDSAGSERPENLPSGTIERFGELVREMSAAELSEILRTRASGSGTALVARAIRELR